MAANERGGWRDGPRRARSQPASRLSRLLNDCATCSQREAASRAEAPGSAPFPWIAGCIARPPMDLATPGQSEWLLRFLDDLDFAAGIVDRDHTFFFANRAMRLALEVAGPLAPESDLFRAVDAVLADGRARAHLVELAPAGGRWSLRLWRFEAGRVAFYGRAVAPIDRPASRIGETLGLAPAEARLAMHVARGKPNSAIARLLGVKLGTLKTRLWKLYRRLGVRNRTELANRIIHCVGAGGKELLLPD
ncbi:MAG: helix-turn-helix transcriptional regulator [Polyangia bacterium]